MSFFPAICAAFAFCHRNAVFQKYLELYPTCSSVNPITHSSEPVAGKIRAQRLIAICRQIGMRKIDPLSIMPTRTEADPFDISRALSMEVSGISYL